MSYFPETIAEALAGRRVRMSYLALFDFVGEPMRVWSGYGTLTSGGHDWLGVGDLASISGLEQAVNGQAPQSSFIVSAANPDTVRLTREEFKEKARDRLARVYIQFHNDDDGKPLTTYDNPFAVWAGRMRTAVFDIQSDGTREITISCESRFALRSRPVASQYTDRDQDRRYPGDLGFQFVAGLRNKVVTWPDF